MRSCSPSLRLPLQLVLGAALLSSAAQALPPPPDHIVIVVEENHGYTQIIGSPAAPYMSSLALSGANLTNIFGITHPSQPNYLHFFSGTNQDVTGNSIPANIPFSTSNLAAALLAANRTFISYSEDLPAPGSQVESNASYFRKHNPVSNWTSPTPGPNQVSPSLNQPFTSFPTDFNLLPTVALVVPNQLHDMHDGTIEDADTWLQSNLGAYADWCQTHNSLLIVTWDEDNTGSRNRIPTILIGPMIRPGNNDSRWTLHNLLRTIEDMYAAQHSGSAATVRPISGIFTTDPTPAILRFQQGAGNYAGALDTQIDQANPNTTHDADLILTADGSPLSQCLIRFDNIIGNLPGQIPPSAAILSAKLSLLTDTASSASTANTMSIHQLLTPWSTGATWNTLTAGISTDNTEAASSPSFSALPNITDHWCIFDATTLTQAWASGTSNHGWLIKPSGTDGWRFASSESAIIADRPQLEVTIDASCAPTITAQPQSTAPCPPAAATFTIAATATGPFTHQWQWRRIGQPLWQNILPGSNSDGIASFQSISGLAPQTDITNYTEGGIGGGASPIRVELRCILASPCGNISSSTATLSIIGARCQTADIAWDTGEPLPPHGPCDPGMSNSGVNEGDYNAFFQGFFDAAPQCDIADDTGAPLPPFNNGQPTGDNNGVNEGDYNAFFQSFFSGCP